MGLTLCHSSLTPRRAPPSGRPAGLPATTKFRGVAEAWFWTMAALAARREGTGKGGARIVRPCDPDDILRCLDQLYRQRRITLAHGHVLRMWGERQTPPDPRYEGEASDHFLWAEVMERLDWPLRAKGIVL